jgi:hypothetical protein
VKQNIFIFRQKHFSDIVTNSYKFNAVCYCINTYQEFFPDANCREMPGFLPPLKLIFPHKTGSSSPPKNILFYLNPVIFGSNFDQIICSGIFPAKQDVMGKKPCVRLWYT